MVETNSRTKKSVVNASVAMIFYIISLILQFISRRVFIQYLGSEILGLNSTATSLLQFLNMAEMGIGAAVAFSLYKPIADKDEQTVCEIIAVQGWLYKRVALFVFVSAIILSFFFPQIFAKTNLPLWYAYSTFGVLLFAAMLSYIFNYKQVILSANQLDYKITLAYKGPKTVKDLVQIIAIWLFPSIGYFLWVILEGIGAIVCTVSLNCRIKKDFPEVASSNLDGGILRKKYPVILTKVKQLLFHKVGAFVLFQTSPLIIYGFTTLTVVAIYGNYMLLVTGITMLLSTIYSGLGAGIGNIIHTSEKSKVMSIFKEIYILRFILVVFCCFGYAICSEYITILWVGQNFLLPKSTVMLIILNMFLNMMRPPIELFIQAKGMFNDIWAPIVESILNIGLSILLGYYFGLNGILIGVAISLICIIFIWKPYFLFTKGFEEKIGYFVKFFLKLSLTALINLSLWISIWGWLKSNTTLITVIDLFLGIIISIFMTITLSCSLFFVDNSAQSLFKRFH